MFQKISIENYKSIKSLPDFEMKPVNILIGANNAGKSNFLDVFAFLRDTLTLSLIQKYEEYSGGGYFNHIIKDGGWREAITKRGGTSSICHNREGFFGIDVSSELFNYSLKIFRGGVNAEIGEEKLVRNKDATPILERDRHGNTDFRLRNGEVKKFNQLENRGMTGLNDALCSKVIDEAAIAFAQKLFEIKIYNRIHTENDSPIRAPKIPKGETILDEDGGNLVGVLHQLSQTEPCFLARLSSLLNVVFDDFAQISFPSGNEGELLIRWEDKSGRISNASQLSDGTLKFLCLIAILKNPNPPAFIGIDEIDANLHPKMQAVLADIIGEISNKTQLVATTHNPDFLSMFSPDEIVVLVKHRGETELRRFSTKGALDLWMKHFGTRKLWLMGELESRW